MEAVEGIRNIEEPLAQYLAVVHMQTGLESLTIGEPSKDPDAEVTKLNEMSRNEFHKKMAVVFDIGFAILAEKRFLIFDDYND